MKAKYDKYCDLYGNALSYYTCIRDYLDYSRDKKFKESLQLVEKRASKNVQDLFRLCEENWPQRKREVK